MCVRHVVMMFLMVTKKEKVEKQTSKDIVVQVAIVSTAVVIRTHTW